MREELHRFFRAARGAGVRVSPAESIDAMKAVADVGFADRDILRDTLLLTLAKNQDEKRALGETFDLFFSQPEVKDETAPEEAANDAANSATPDATAGETRESGALAPELGELAQMLMSQDRSAVAAALANAASAASLSDIRYFTQRGIFSTRILNQLGIERLRDDLDALTSTNPAEAERLAAALTALRENVGEIVSQALVLYGREESENLRNEILRNAPLARLERRQVEQMKALIRAIARRLQPAFCSIEAYTAGTGLGSVAGELADALRDCVSGRELRAAGFENDVALAAQLDASDGVPLLRDGAFTTFPFSGVHSVEGP